MEISFTTKEENKKSKEADFLKVSGAERVFAFFKLCYEMRDFPSNKSSEKTETSSLRLKLEKTDV